jgi:hypothetical protein
MEKNLPIKLFKKRDNDTAKNNLSVIIGDNQGLRFRLEGERLDARIHHFRGYFGGLKTKIQEKVNSDNYLPTVVKLKLNEDAHAKSYRSEIGKIFNGKSKKINIIGLIGDDELLVKIDNIQDLEEIETKIQDAEKNIIGISAIEQAVDFTPIIDIDVEDNRDLKVKLINYGDYRLNEIAERSFENLCKELGVKYDKLNYAKDLILYRVSSVKPQSLINSKESESIFSITKMPVIKLTKSDLAADKTIEIKTPEEGVDYYKVGIFDEGISDIDYLRQWKNGSYVAFGTGEYDKAHGTFVAGILNYGDELEGKDWTGTKPFKITEAVVFPNAKYGYIDEPMMVEFMREAVKKYPEVKVWNFSIGNETAVQDDKYSDFATYLDDLQTENNILIVKAAGNCTNFAKAAPRGRITEGSESVKTLVVGSLSHDKRAQDIAHVNHPSPFSTVGPGCADVIKPDLVHYGGNAGIKDGKVDINGIKSFSEDGQICSAVGTSYSAPRVTALAAELAGSMNEEFNPELIKALLIHSAEHPEEFDAELMDRISQIGFGLPSKVSSILFNDSNEVTLILMDSVDKGSSIKIMDFPYPQSLIEDGYFYGQVKITLVTAPEINSYQGAEYVQSDVDIAFGTYEEKEVVIGSKIKRNPIDMKDPQNLLLPSKYSTRKQKSASVSFKSERFLHSYSDNRSKLFLPIKKWCVDFEELQEAHKKTSLHKDRSWYMKVEAAYRNDYDMRMKDSKDISQEFVLIITVRDPKKKEAVYNEVTNLLTQYNFIHENIRVDERVVING